MKVRAATGIVIIIVFRASIGNVPFANRYYIRSVHGFLNKVVRQSDFIQVVLADAGVFYNTPFVLIFADIVECQMASVMEESDVVGITVLPSPVLSGELTERLILIRDVVAGIISYDVFQLLLRGIRRYGSADMYRGEDIAADPVAILVI